MEWTRGAFTITDDPGRIDIEWVSGILMSSYWGQGRTPEVVADLTEKSMCFSMFDGDTQIGFARVATDYTVSSWLSDLVIAESHRNRGLGTWMTECVLSHPAIAHTQFVLQTMTAHALYERFGFGASDRLMIRPPPAH